VNRSPLTELEVEVALLVAAGLTDREIARRLDLPVPAVRSEVARIRRKLGVASSRGDDWGNCRARPLDDTGTMSE